MSRSAASGVAAGPRSRVRDDRRRVTSRVLPPPLRRPDGSLFVVHPSPHKKIIDLGRARAARALGAVAGPNMPEKVPRDDGHAVRAVPVESQRMVAEAVRNEIQPMLERLDALVAATDEVLTMNGVQKLLGACSKTVLAWIRDQGLPARKIGAEWRFRKSYVVQWIGGHDVR